MKICLAFLVSIFFLLSVSVFGQAEPEAQKIDLPEEVWKEVVPRVLKDRFKPAKSPITVELYDEGLRWEWLPTIENVSFVLLSKAEIHARQIEVHFFVTKARRAPNGEIEVDFGFGDVFCSNTGSTWVYRESKGPGALKRSSGGWGTGCGSGDVSGH